MYLDLVRHREGIGDSIIHLETTVRLCRFYDISTSNREYHVFSGHVPHRPQLTCTRRKISLLFGVGCFLGIMRKLYVGW